MRGTETAFECMLSFYFHFRDSPSHVLYKLRSSIIYQLCIFLYTSNVTDYVNMSLSGSIERFIFRAFLNTDLLFRHTLKPKLYFCIKPTP